MELPSPIHANKAEAALSFADMTVPRTKVAVHTPVWLRFPPAGLVQFRFSVQNLQVLHELRGCPPCPPTFFARISKQAAYVRHFNDINHKDLFRFIQVEPTSCSQFRVRITFLAGFCLCGQPSEPAPTPCVFISILTEGSTAGYALQPSGQSQPLGHKANVRKCRFLGAGNTKSDDLRLTHGGGRRTVLRACSSNWKFRLNLEPRKRVHRATP